VGDKVLAYFTDGARHFGMAIEEQIIEKWFIWLPLYYYIDNYYQYQLFFLKYE
jgi:hypothetical protein